MPLGGTILLIPGLKYNPKTPFKQKWFYRELLIKPLTFSIPFYCQLKADYTSVLVFSNDLLKLIHRDTLLLNGDIFPDVLHDLLRA